MNYNIVPRRITEHTDLDNFNEHEAKEHGWTREMIRAALYEIQRRERDEALPVQYTRGRNKLFKT